MDLRFDGVSKKFGETTAFEIPRLEIRSGELFTFVGPAGCGKSSILNVIAGVEAPSSGTLTAGDRVVNDLPAESRGITLVAATDVLAERSEAISLFDDPLQGLEPAERTERRDALTRHHERVRATFIFTTEDQAEALAISDRLAVLDDGRLQQIGTPAEIYEIPANDFVASYFGAPAMNVVPGILEKDGQAVDIGNRAVPLSRMVRDLSARDVSLGIRPEHVRLSPADQGGWRARVTRVDRVGGRTAVEVAVDMGVFVAVVDADEEASYEPGDAVVIRLPKQHLHVFDVRGHRLEMM